MLKEQPIVNVEGFHRVAFGRVGNPSLKVEYELAVCEPYVRDILSGIFDPLTRQLAQEIVLLLLFLFLL